MIEIIFVVCDRAARMESGSLWSLDNLTPCPGFATGSICGRPSSACSTDLYVQKLTHSYEEKRHYTELALRLLNSVDAATRLAVATRLARHLSPPVRVMVKLASDLPDIAALVRSHPVLLPEAGPDENRPRRSPVGAKAPLPIQVPPKASSASTERRPPARRGPPSPPAVATRPAARGPDPIKPPKFPLRSRRPCRPNARQRPRRQRPRAPEHDHRRYRERTQRTVLRRQRRGAPPHSAQSAHRGADARRSRQRRPRGARHRATGKRGARAQSRRLRRLSAHSRCASRACRRAVSPPTTSASRSSQQPRRSPCRATCSIGSCSSSIRPSAIRSRACMRWPHCSTK